MQLEYGGQRVTIAAGDLIIGSAPEATVRLAGPTVLPRHALVRLAQPGQAVIQPATAEAVVRVNGTPVGREPTPVMHGDRIQIGGEELVVSDPARGGATEVRSALPGGAVGGAPAPGRSRPPAGRLVSLTDGREYAVDTVPFILGRDASAEVVIASPDASRRHAEIATRPDGDVLVDLSVNGTYVNGNRIEGRHKLKALDVIRIGADEFRYYPPAPVPPPRSSTPPAGAEYRLGDTLMGIPATPRIPRGPAVGPRGGKPLADLLIRKGSGKGQRLPVMSPLVNVGRAEYNDLRIPDPSVSASHAKIQLREGVWTLIDLGSTNGTLVDGVTVTDEAPLSPGTVITLGDVDLLFEPHDEGVASEPATRVLSRPGERAPEAEPGGLEEKEIRRAVANDAGSWTESASPPSRSNTVVLTIGVVVLLAALAVLALLL